MSGLAYPASLYPICVQSEASQKRHCLSCDSLISDLSLPYYLIQLRQLLKLCDFQHILLCGPSRVEIYPDKIYQVRFYDLYMVADPGEATDANEPPSKNLKKITF